MYSTLTLLIVGGLGASLIGCASRPVASTLPANHPANPAAAQAPYAPAPDVLVRTPSAAPASQPNNGTKGMKMNQPMRMHHGNVHDMDMGKMDMDMDHSQSQPARMKAATTQPSSQIVYTCVMHPQIATPQPGQCPICGMKLVPRTTPQQSAEGRQP